MIILLQPKMNGLCSIFIGCFGDVKRPPSFSLVPLATSDMWNCVLIGWDT